MRRHMDRGLAAAQAAALVLAPAGQEPARHPFAPDACRRELAEALERLDEPSAQAILDRILAVATVDLVLSEVVLPLLRELGERWEGGEISVAQEHFASNLIRGRLLGLARGWGRGAGPVALLACPPGEQHDLGLLAFGIALRGHGWRIAYLGADTPVDTLEVAAGALRPAIVVLSATTWERVAPTSHLLRCLARRLRLALGGAAANAPRASQLGFLLLLPGDPVSEAARVAALGPEREAVASTT